MKHLYESTQEERISVAKTGRCGCGVIAIEVTGDPDS